MLDYSTRSIVVARTRGVFIGIYWVENGEIFFSFFFLFQGEFKTVAPGEGLAVRPFSAREC